MTDEEHKPLTLSRRLFIQTVVLSSIHETDLKRSEFYCATLNLLSGAMNSKHSYEGVLGDDQDVEEDISIDIDLRYNRLRTKLAVALWVLSMTAVLFNIILCTALLSHRTPKLNGTDIHTCGNTSTEARSNNCVFDILGYNWIPRRCYDAETAVEFNEWVHDPARKFGAFPFFTSGDASQRIKDMSELSDRVHIKTFTTQEEHVGHCVFLLRRLERARYSAFQHETLGGYAHVEHCSKQILAGLQGENPGDVGRVRSIFEVGFISC